MGNSFACPHLIGGGEFRSFRDAKTLAGELVARVHALVPMRQFWAAPWRILNAQSLEIRPIRVPKGD
jgi:hypothetical protein